MIPVKLKFLTYLNYFSTSDSLGLVAFSNRQLNTAMDM